MEAAVEAGNPAEVEAASEAVSPHYFSYSHFFYTKNTRKYVISVLPTGGWNIGGGGLGGN